MTSDYIVSFRRGMGHYLDNVENETKILAFSLPPNLLEKVDIDFKSSIYDESTAKKLFKKVQSVNFTPFS